MITTRDLRVEPPKKVNLKQRYKSRSVTTKTVDASIRVEPPKEPIKPRGISTTSLPDVTDIAEKKRRDDIMAEVKAAKEAEEKKKKQDEIIANLKGEPVDDKPFTDSARYDEDEEKKLGFEIGDAVYQDEKGKLIVKEKPEKSIEEVAKEAEMKLEKKKSFACPTIPPSLEGMIAEKKKLAMKERMAKVRAAKKKKAPDKKK